MVKTDAVVAPAAAVGADSKAAAFVGVDTVRIDRKWQMTPGTQVRAASGQDIRNHHSRTHDDRSLGDVPAAADMDVRTVLEVGERLQDGRSRRFGNVCDSLVL